MNLAMHHCPWSAPRLALLSGLLAVGLPGVDSATTHASDLRRTAIVKAVERVRAAVVNIHGEKELSREEAAYAALENERHVNGMGTGVVIDQRGYILTNQHVVEGVKCIHVTLAEGDTHVAELISRDAQTDLAVIKIEPPRLLPIIPWGTSSDLLVGEPVIAVGNAFGYQHTVTRGIVSSLHRTVEVGEGQQYEDLIQTDASINPGNSGGPLLNIDGELIGINVAVRAGAQGIGFAIPVDKVERVAADLLSVRRVDHRWHGVTLVDAHGEGGLRVSAVSANSPAAKSGLQAGDWITHLAGEPVARALDFERGLVGLGEGTAVELRWRRGKETAAAPLALATAPNTPKPVGNDQAWDVLGLRLASITPRKFHDLSTQYRGGLLVSAVRPGSPAAEQGIRRGDVLVGMHHWETVTLENVAYILARPDLDQLVPVKFYILRDDRTLFGHLPLRSTALR